MSEGEQPRVVVTLGLEAQPRAEIIADPGEVTRLADWIASDSARFAVVLALLQAGAFSPRNGER